MYITAYNTHRYLLKDMFARHTGYNAVGELNNIIILYPQAIAIIDNPMGCWDWWGYTVHAYGKYNIIVLFCLQITSANF